MRVRSIRWIPFFCCSLVASWFGPFAADVAVDPSGPGLTRYASLGEWSSDGQLEGWTTSQLNAVSVAGGFLSATDDGVPPTDPKVQLLGLSDGPDLDLGYNDYLEFRLRLPAGYAGGIQVYWGTTASPGVASSKLADIGPASVPRDGEFHVYRIEMALEPAWRDILRDVRIDPLDGDSGSGLAFSLDYVRVGDVGPDYEPNYLYYPQGTADVNDMTSKHFRVVWGPGDEVNMGWGTFSTDGPAIARGNLRNMEDQWQVYTRLGFREPSESVDPGKRNGTRYKVNLFVGRTGLSRHTGGGYFMGYDGESGFGWLTIDNSGLRPDPPSWVNPHELGHVFQVHQTGYNNNSYMGFWWECHANWFREQYLSSPLYPEAGESGFGSAFPRNAHLFHGHGRHYYDHWPIWSYLEENPDGLPRLGPGFGARLWQEALPKEYIYDQLSRMCPEVSVKDILGHYVRRNATWDYSNQKAIRDSLGVGPTLDWTGSYRRQALTELTRRPDAPDGWQVPLELAPMQGAYNIVELEPEGQGGGRLVTAELRGLAAPDRGSDWRACLVALKSDGSTRYGSVWSTGPASIQLAADEPKVYLAVVATPDEFVPQEASEERYPYATHPARVRFPYEVRVTGAVPLEFRPTNEGQTGAAHSNGGGFVASGARVDSTAYVGPNAKVLDTAQVRGRARIEDFAVVEDTAQVRDDAVVSGHARIRGNARVLGFAKVRDYGEVRDSARIEGHGRVIEHGTAAETVLVTDRAVVKGCAYSWDDPNGSSISGHGICDGDYAAGHSVRSGVLFGWLIDADHALSREGTLPDGLYAGYEFHRRHPSLAEDSFGVTHGYLQGSPEWLAEDSGHSGVLRLSGLQQYALLPRSVSDLDDITVACWVKWDGGSPGQRIFEFGSSPSKYMYLTPDDGAGKLTFAIRSGGAQETLSAAALPSGTWKQVALVLQDGNGTIYVDAEAVAAGSITMDPEDLNAPNTISTPQANYLGRGQSGNYFRGSFDNFRVYSRALTAEEIRVLSAPPPEPIVEKGSVWKYNDSGTDLGSAWAEPDFNDGSWPGGRAQLGFGDGDEATAIRDRNQITTYFRQAFTLENVEDIVILELKLLRDDGAVVHLNGREAFRSNMPEGAVAYDTLASAAATGEDETTTFYAASLDVGLLVPGRNVLAVEVHQSDANSSDVSFDLELLASALSRKRSTFHRGDPDGDGASTISDAISLLSFLFAAGVAPACMESADVNSDGGVDLADAVRVLVWLFASGPQPGAPGPPGSPCGSDTDTPGSTGDLGCRDYPPCR